MDIDLNYPYGHVVVGKKFCDGVVIAADNLITMHAMCKYDDVQRVFKISDRIIMGGSGDFAHVQEIVEILNHEIRDTPLENKSEKTAESLSNYLKNNFYQLRFSNRFKVDIILGGIVNDKPFLSRLDGQGYLTEANEVSSKTAEDITLPLLRQHDDKLSQENAVALMGKCMEVLNYTYCHSVPDYTLAVCTKRGSEIIGPLHIREDWAIANTW